MPEKKKGGKRRAPNEGSIYQRPGRQNPWQGELYLGHGPDGKKRVIRVSGQSREEVAAKLADLNSKRYKGQLSTPQKAKVKDWLSRWLKEVRPNVKASTYRSYADQVRVHINPTLGNILLTKLRPDQVQEFYNEKAQTHLSPRSVQYIHQVFSMALDRAVQLGLVVENVTKRTVRPRVEKKPVSPPPLVDAVRLLKAAREERFCAVYVLAITTGLRRGEIFGLRWSDLNLEAGLLEVRNTVTVVEGKLIQGPPKTRASRRMVALPAEAVQALQERQVQQKVEKAMVGSAWQETELVFTTEIGTPADPGNFVKRSFHPLIKKLGLKLRFHDLRHAAVSYMLAAGVPLKAVQAQAGHSTASMTLDIYGHLLPGGQKEAAAKISEILAAAREPEV